MDTNKKLTILGQLKYKLYLTQRGENVYAVVRTGGKQYKVTPGIELLVEKIEAAKPGEKLVLSDVLLYSDGTELHVGKPSLSVEVECLCISQEKGEKLRTIKYRRRHNYKRTYGHRQNYTRLLIEKVSKKGN